MKFIPAVVLILGFINCDSDSQPPAQAVDAAVSAEANAKTDAGSAEAPVPEEPKKAPFLWEVTKDGYHNTSWIFGAVNDPKLPIEFEIAPQRVQLALERSTHAYFEIPSGSAAHRDRTKLMARKEGSLRKEIGSDRVKKLTELTTYQANVLDVMHPWVVYLTLEEKLSADPPMDEAWEGFAKSHRKRILYLESVGEQVSVLDKAITFENLKPLIDDFEKHSEQRQEIANAYNAQDTDALKAALFPADNKRAEIRAQLVGLRLPRWAAKLDAQMHADPTFVVVNAAYLLGDKNLITMLREKGWKVERQAP